MILFEGRIPGRVMFDTGVFFRWLGDRPTENSSAYCVELGNLLASDAKRRLLVAAPTLAEAARTKGRVPRQPGVEIVAFDERAAEILGSKVTNARLTEVTAGSGLPKSYFKYDGLIMACAVRGRADCLVTLDPDDHRKLAATVGLRVATPMEFFGEVVDFGDIDEEFAEMHAAEEGPDADADDSA